MSRIAELEKRVSALEEDNEHLQVLVDTYHRYKDLIGDLMAIQQSHGLPLGGGNLPDQFAGALGAIAGKSWWLDLREQYERWDREREALPERRALRRIVSHWEEHGADDRFRGLMAYGKEALR